MSIDEKLDNIAKQNAVIIKQNAMIIKLNAYKKTASMDERVSNLAQEILEATTKRNSKRS